MIIKVNNHNGIGNEYREEETGEFASPDGNSVNGIEEYTSEYQNNDVYKAQEMSKKSYQELIGSDQNRLYRYREWANNSNNDYKEYIYKDLKNGKKTAALNFWYNQYKLKSGEYDLSFKDFLNTPMRLYRATNKNEKEDVSNPFFSYATNKNTAERFLDSFQRLDSNRTGEIEEIYIAPIDTLGMFPSDEDEIIVPNQKYEEDNKNIESVVDNLIRYANKNNVELPYDKDYIFELFKKRDLINRVKLKTNFKDYVDERKKEENPYEQKKEENYEDPFENEPSTEENTFIFPNLQGAIDYYKSWKDRNVRIETIPIKKLVNDNNLMEDWQLESYHKIAWENKPAKDFSYDRMKEGNRDNTISNVPYATKKKDGTLQIGDGKHRIRALYNDGYKYVKIPIIDE